MSIKKTTRSLPAEREPKVRLPARLLTDIRGLIEDARQNGRCPIGSWNLIQE